MKMKFATRAKRFISRWWVGITGTAGGIVVLAALWTMAANATQADWFPARRDFVIAQLNAVQREGRETRGVVRELQIQQIENDIAKWQFEMSKITDPGPRALADQQIKSLERKKKALEERPQ